jgi:hypothetical protein
MPLFRARCQGIIQKDRRAQIVNFGLRCQHVTSTEAQLLRVLGLLNLRFNCNINELLKRTRISISQVLNPVCTGSFLPWRQETSRSSLSQGVCYTCSSRLLPKFLEEHLQVHEDKTANPDAGKPIRKLPKEVEISLNASSEELYTAFSAASGCSVHRLRITKGSDRSVISNSNTTTIDATGLRNSSVIHVKDLGAFIFHTNNPNQAPQRQQRA